MKKALMIIFAAILSIAIIGCSSPPSNAEDTTDNSIRNSELIDESIVSPNEAYIQSEEDKVIYKIAVYQNKDYSILVSAQANTPFFDETSYTIAYDQRISASDVTIQWSTLMGNTNATEKDQLGIATVTLLEDHTVISERKINFAKKAIETIVEGIHKNEPHKA